VSKCDTGHWCHTCNICHICIKYHCNVSLVTKCVTGDFLQLTFNDVGRGEGAVKKCFLSLRQTALLSAEGKKASGSAIVQVRTKS
jgi:hypothetical protein